MKLPARAHHKAMGLEGRRIRRTAAGGQRWLREAGGSLHDPELVAAGKPYPREAFCCLSQCKPVLSLPGLFWENGDLPKKVSGSWNPRGRRKRQRHFSGDSGVPNRARRLSEKSPHPFSEHCLQTWHPPLFLFLPCLADFLKPTCQEGGNFCFIRSHSFSLLFYLLRIKYDLL